ncbi:MAG: IS110 family transposase [Deltaproteobacteria bacterium]|nr:MAG: IS110 family transposase [Deltaproteobacteria bacterium]
MIPGTFNFNSYRKGGFMQHYYLGIDVSKGYADFVILNDKKRPIEENFQLDDTFEGHCCLYERLLRFFDDHPDSTMYAALESTGGYEDNWFRALIKFQGTLNLKTARLNPLGVHANSKADLKRNVTDKISAQNVAEYMIAHPEKISYQQEDHLASLRKQWGFIKMLTKQSTQLLNQLESLIYTANPELLVYCRDGVPEWLLKLLIHYPTASSLSKAKIVKVARIPYISADRAKELVGNAKKSVASATDKVTGKLIVATVKQILHLKQVIKVQTGLMAQECSVPEVDLLKSFTGIKDFSAIGLMLEIQTMERFLSAKKLASFFGLHPVYKVSGDGIGGFRMSKRGRKEPRQILFMVALSAIQSNPLIRGIYLEHIQKGMEKMAAIGLCMHKILRIIYGMLKHNSVFDPEIDRRNREKMVHRNNRVSKDKNRRYQAFDSRAPISRRQHSKREERKQSHSDNNTNNGIIAPAPLST